MKEEEKKSGTRVADETEGEIKVLKSLRRSRRGWNRGDDKERKQGERDLEGTKDAGRGAWAVCVWRPGRCDGRYLHSAWSSQMVYLSKASRPGLGPP